MNWNMVLVIFVSIVPSINTIPKYNECPPEKRKCVYWLVVQEHLTMIETKHKILVHPVKGKLFPYYDHHGNRSSQISPENIITADGVYRMVVTVNKTIPGPPIVVYENQELVVHVHNLLLSDSVTIHWHGLHQRGTPFMDGVGYITQCPIGAGQKFTYQFKASPRGTFWYHSHVGVQRTNGVYGALIVRERPMANKKYPIDIIMTVGDWYHASGEEVFMKMIYGNFQGDKKYRTTKTLDGSHFSNIPWVSGLINGRGRYTRPDTGQRIEAPITWFNVTTGKTYRFRVIQVGTMYPLKISVDGHMIDVVASDGCDIVPKTVESFIINPGERYDFLLQANRPIRNYWIRAVSLEVGFTNHSVEAVLHYDGADNDAEPTTSRMRCTRHIPCVILNCPFWYYPEPTRNCILVSELESADKNDSPPEYTADSEEHFLNFAFPGKSVAPGAVNGRKFVFPGVNSLMQDDMIGEYECDRKNCGKDKVCYCHYQLSVPYNKTIQMIWLNMGRGAGWGHPIHMHGHSFYVLKMAYANQNPQTGKIFPKTYRNHQDIDCGGGLNLCNEARWRNDSWRKGNIPGLNLKNPPRKDTLIIPSGAYAVLRFKSDNPGKWFIHCHIEIHHSGGMAMVLSEAHQYAPKPPKGFPICNNFYNEKLMAQSNPLLQAETDCAVEDKSYLIPMVAMGTLIMLLIVALFVSALYRSRYDMYTEI